MDFSLFIIDKELFQLLSLYIKTVRNKEHHHWISSHLVVMLFTVQMRGLKQVHTDYLLYIHVTFSHPSFLLLVTLAVAQALPPLLH